MRKASCLNVAALVLLTIGMCGCNPTHPGDGFYPKVQIGPGDTMKPTGERSLAQPSLLSFTEYMRGAYLASATHLLRTSQFAPAHAAFYLESSLESDKLDRTVKTTQLLQSDFGNMFLVKTCFYNRSFDTNLDTLSIGRNDGEAESAEQVTTLPATGKTPDSFALLRVYRDGEGAVVLTGNYEFDGTLRSLHIDHTRSHARLRYPEDGIWIDPVPPKMLQSPNPATLGLPLTLRPPAAGQSFKLPTAPLPVVTDVLFTTYGEGALVREDVLADGRNGLVGVKETRYMRSSVVDEQRLLEPACNAQLTKQQAARKRTVE